MGVVTKYPIPMSERIFCVMGDSGRKPVSRESSTCTDASNLWPLSPIPAKVVRHTPYFFTSLKKQKEVTEEQLEKTQTIQKTKIFVFGAFRTATYFLEVFDQATVFSFYTSLL